MDNVLISGGQPVTSRGGDLFVAIVEAFDGTLITLNGVRNESVFDSSDDSTCLTVPDGTTVDLVVPNP
jgi:hypothetical protein